MIAGRVTSEREAVIRVQVQAPGGDAEMVEAALDTGFTEYIGLPPDRIARLRLPLVGLQPMRLGDGSVAVLAVHEALVWWHGAWLVVQALEVQGGALVGMALLHGSRLTMDVVRDGPVRIEPLDGADGG